MFEQELFPLPSNDDTPELPLTRDQQDVFSCSICFETFNMKDEPPMSCSRGHSKCLTCFHTLHKWKDREYGDVACPECKSETFSPNQALINALQKTVVTCVRKGCKREMYAEMFFAHYKGCKKKSNRCPFFILGCHEKTITAKQMDEHIKECRKKYVNRVNTISKTRGRAIFHKIYGKKDEVSPNEL